MTQTPSLLLSNRRYLGAKTKLLPLIDQALAKVGRPLASFADLFAGTGVVAAHANAPHTAVLVNDLLASNRICYETWLGTDPWRPEVVAQHIEAFNRGAGDPDPYVAENFPGFFFPQHAERIGAVRARIAALSRAGDLWAREESMLLASLLFATDKVAQTFGHFEAFRKKKDATPPVFAMKIPRVDDARNMGNTIHQRDAVELAGSVGCEFAYIDPPYNSRQYGDAYHVHETLIAWTKPELFGIARKPAAAERKAAKSAFCTKKAPEAFADLIRALDSRWIAVSYNNMAEKGDGRSNAKISEDDIVSVLSEHARVTVFDTPYKHFSTGKRGAIADHREIVYLADRKAR